MSDWEFSYKPRPVRRLELWQCDGWRVKVYGIRLGGTQPDLPLIEAAKKIAKSVLPAPAVTPDRYGIGILGIHQGEGYNQVFVDWWENQNELRHHYFRSTGEDSFALDDDTASGRAFCTWDLGVLAFERDAWVKCVLKQVDGPDIDAYLAAGLDSVL